MDHWDDNHYDCKHAVANDGDNRVRARDFAIRKRPFEHFNSSLGSRRIQDDVYGLGILPCVKNCVDVDAIVEQDVVYRKLETL